VQLRKQAVSALCLTAVLMGGLVVSGCNDNVEVLRDPSIRVSKGMTWAWRPQGAPPSVNAKRDNDNRPVVSRDVISQAPPPQLESNRDWNTEANRDKLQKAIEQALKNKGLVQVSDPAAADFLVDYHVAVRTQRATVGTVYPGWGWYGWGWGPPEVEYRNVAWHQGTFVLDLALRNPKTLAYRAIGHKELNNKPSISEYQAQEAVNHLLKGLKVQ
jgi:hypothetical protein